jgi:hypothetical protein
MTSEEHEALLKSLAHQYGMSIVEVADAARMAASMEMDPLKVKGEWFVFQHNRPRTTPIDLDDFCSFNTEVPPPDANVNLFDAMAECRRDAENCEYALKHDLSLKRLRQISLNQLAWQRFWAMRHPNAEMRELLAKRVKEGEAAITENAEKANALRVVRLR